MDNYFWEMLSLVRNKNIKIILNYFLGPLVFVILTISIYRQIQHQPNWQESLLQLRKAFTGPFAWFLFLAFLLIFVNWGIEARKWQVVMSKLQTLSFWQSYKAIFTGTTMASFTPNRTGEYFGRVLYVDEGKRLPAIPLTIVCSMAQLQVTLYTGIIAMFTLEDVVANFLAWDRSIVLFSKTILYVALAAVILLTLIYFRIGWFVRKLHSWRPRLRFIRYIEVIEQLNATILLRILSLSVGRYLVFVLQYYLVFRVFEVQISWAECLMAISILFLLLAVIPSFTFLTDLGIRWKAGIEIVSIFSSNTIGIFATAFTIWVFNLIIPALIGSLLILGIRIYKNKEA